MTSHDAGPAADPSPLPDPDEVLARVRGDTAGDHPTKPADATPNLAVAGQVSDGVELTDDAYVGPTAGVLGRLAAALTVADDATVHYPDPNFTADGPWLVLAPLDGSVSTVATGTGRATLTLSSDADGASLDALEACLLDLLEAARPSHDHYPVADDDRGVFTTGMTTFALESLSVDRTPTATFAVSTTPATSPEEVEARFDAVPSVEHVRYEPVAGVERAAPSGGLREAVEAAHRDVLGDCEYEWLPAGGVFAQIPGAEKVALGTGVSGAKSFGRAEYATLVELLDAALANLEVEA